MKRFILLALWSCFIGVLKSQDASVIYKNTANSTVTIETDKGLGSGFFIAENIIATNYHVIESASKAVCYTNNSTEKFKIKRIISTDKKADLALLEVVGINKPAIKITSSSVSPGQKVFVIGSPKGLPTTISDGIVSGLRDFEGRSLIQITAPISPGSSGGPVLNANGELIGISVGQFTEGQNLNFAIPSSKLEELLKSKNKNPTSLSSENEKETDYQNHHDIKSHPYQKKPSSAAEDKVYKLGILREGDSDLSLDYFANTEKSSIFFFTYKYQNKNQLAETLWMEEYSLVDHQTGKVYTAKNTDLPNKNNPRVIYNGTKTRFIICFDRLPSSLKNFSLREGDCNKNSFCFLNINLNHYYEATDLDVNLYKENSEDGTVTFYQNDKNNGKIDISIEGYQVGKLTEYFTNSNYVPQCGDNSNASLTIRLPAGNYNFTAKSNNLNWKGKITISKNGCNIQKLGGR